MRLGGRLAASSKMIEMRHQGDCHPFLDLLTCLTKGEDALDIR